MRVNSESASNEIDESDLQFEKYDEQRIWTWRGMTINVILVPWNARGWIWVTTSAAAGERKKTHEGRMMPPPDCRSDPVAVGDPLETQTVTPATTKEPSDILMNCRNCPR
jgi:hypothetical protein